MQSQNVFTILKTEIFHYHDVEKAGDLIMKMDEYLGYYNIVRI
jgi:putative transposase